MIPLKIDSDWESTGSFSFIKAGSVEIPAVCLSDVDDVDFSLDVKHPTNSYDSEVYKWLTFFICTINSFNHFPFALNNLPLDIPKKCFKDFWTFFGSDPSELICEFAHSLFDLRFDIQISLIQFSICYTLLKSLWNQDSLLYKMFECYWQTELDLLCGTQFTATVCCVMCQ